MKTTEHSRTLAGATGSAIWWYTARIENYQGIHGVFYSTTRPKIGDSCDGIAKPNRIVGYRRELAPYSSPNNPGQPRET